MQQSGSDRTGQRAGAVSEQDQEDGRRQREAGPGSERSGVAGADQTDGKSGLARRRARQELAQCNSVLIASHDRNAAIFTFRGANTLLEADDLRDEAFAVDVLYVANLSNESADCFPAIVKRG